MYANLQLMLTAVTKGASSFPGAQHYRGGSAAVAG